MLQSERNFSGWRWRGVVGWFGEGLGESGDAVMQGGVLALPIPIRALHGCGTAEQRIYVQSNLGS
jgi:hypothetical protein